MKEFKRLKKYKAREPEQTIEIIRGILHGLGIEITESQRERKDAGVFSSRIYISNGKLEIGDFGTNGKGMSESYSRASAYGEMMERLCNFMLFGDYPENAYANGLVKYVCAPDEVWMDAREAAQNGADVLGKLFRINGQEMLNVFANDKKPCVPYYSLFGDKQVYLPHKSLRVAAGSNGMAAGNTYKEAVAQGLCELYERAAVMEAYRDNPKIRQIRLESFKGNAVYEKLSGLIEKGFQVAVLDLSMGKDYPVVGLILEKAGAKAFRAGADPCPVTALERCLTEIFQGEEAQVNNFFKTSCCPAFTKAKNDGERYMINDQEIAYHVDGSGLAPDCIFNYSNEYNDEFAGTDGESEEADYDYMLGLTKKLGYNLYIRDWSFLGFPVYHIIVPELSNYDLMYQDGAFFYEISFDNVPFRPDIMLEDIGRILNALFCQYELHTPVQDKSMMSNK